MSKIIKLTINKNKLTMDKIILTKYLSKNKLTINKIF